MQPLEPSNYRALALSATCEVAMVLDESVRSSTEDGRVGLVAAEKFLQRLRDWSRALPAELRQRLRQRDDHNYNPSYRESAIGSVHVASVYYFGVILLTRPFLVQRIMPRLRGRSMHSDADAEQHTVYSEKEIEFAEVCVEAATYMVQMCSEAIETGLIWGNMRILK